MTNLDDSLTISELIKKLDVGGGEIRICVKDNVMINAVMTKKVYQRKAK